ncbi:hypothetical protein [Streptomyces sp. NPDC014734]|uniref:hypothetical protein n=1 Tax=Streptomyces sp. NPDC014734 TaxID=3364886 RepID=UPI0036FF45D9
MTPRPARRSGAPRSRRSGGSRTRRLLDRYLAALLLLAAVAAAALIVSYREVQVSADEMRTRAAPAVQGVAATQLALLRAHQEARNSVDRDIDSVVGAGARYENQLAAASQGLSRLSDVQIDGDRGRGVLETVNGVLTSYSSSITPGTVKYVSDDLMQQEKFAEAERLLEREGTGVVPRLDVLQRHQTERVGAISSMGTARRTGWIVAETALLAMALTTLAALRMLRTRCGRSHDPWLLVSLVITVGLAVLPLWATALTQHRLDAAREGLVRIDRRAHDHRALAEAQRYVTDTSTGVRADLAARDWQNWAYYGALGGSALIVLLPAVGIGRRLNADYWRAG